VRAVVCGAGIAGLTLAWWLERDGWDVLLVEHAPARRSGGYMMDFFGPGFDVAERMGLLGELRRARTDITALEYLGPDGRVRNHVPYAALAGAVGDRVVSLMRGDLEDVLHRAVADRAEIRYATTIDAITAGGVVLSDGSREPADLVAGADGIRSRVRRLTFGPDRGLRPLGYHTASYLFADPGLARRVGDRFAVVAAPGRQAGVYPTADGRLAVSLIHHTGAALPADPADEVRRVYAGLGDLADRALAHCPGGSGLYYDLVAQVELDRWHRGRTVLLGDAAAAVSLMAGQGASLAMTGAWVLADALRGAGSVPDALRAYQERMLPLARRTQRSGRRTARWLVPPGPVRLAVRTGGLRLLTLPGATRVARAAFAPPRL
jgi:2-polyprenyl-6-methoxyphenol hydroxylase-like FAD-dependent oxidoreductase